MSLLNKINPISNLMRVGVRLHSSASRYMKVPFPTDACPDHATFLKSLGKEAEKCVDKFEGWNDLFKCKSSDMKEKGLTSKQRKLILDKAHKFVLGFEPTHKKKHKRGAKKNEIARMKAKSK